MSNIPVKDVTPKTQSMYEKRKKIYVREIEGFFQKLRTYTLWALMLAYFGTAWLSWEGKQLVFFDLPARQFHIFGLTFWPQDFPLLAALLIISAYALFTVTNLAGRLWCGYTCPQSAWSFIFMWIEERAEGNRNERIRLDKQKMSATKFRKKAIKHIALFVIAFWTGVTFVGYFTPIRELIPDLLAFNVNGWGVFWIAMFTVLTYLNAGWMREQVCIYMCPYARFQSVMYDRDTLAVSYDTDRGEPRGHRSKKKMAKLAEEGKTLGDCVDCALCVQVCPTGIDIRDGMQYQCIGCALCVDACDSVMDKMKMPRGLIRYTTENELEGQKTHFFRPRLVGYATMLALMIGGFTFAMLTRTPFELDIERSRGALYQVTPNDTVKNSYYLKLMNMSQSAESYSLKVDGLEGATMNVPSEYDLDVNDLKEVAVTLEIDPAEHPLKDSKTVIEFVVTQKSTGEEVAREESRFIAPRGL